ADEKTVRLDIAKLTPTWGMEIKYRVKAVDGRAVVGTIHNSIHNFCDSSSSKPISHTDRNIEEWTVRVDDRLLQAPNDELGTKALRFLAGKLADIRVVVPEDRLKKLQSVVIVLDLSHGKLESMQYHPSADWLRSNGYSPDLAKCVHIPRAADLAVK